VKSLPSFESGSQERTGIKVLKSPIAEGMECLDQAPSLGDAVFNITLADGTVITNRAQYGSDELLDEQSEIFIDDDNNS